MTITTLTPNNSTPGSTAITYTGGASIHAVASDANDATYYQYNAGAASANDILEFSSASAIGSDTITYWWLTVRAKLTSASTPGTITGGLIGPNGEYGGSSRSVLNTTFTYYTIAQGAQYYGSDLTSTILEDIQAFIYNTPNVIISEIKLDIFHRADAPILTISSPTAGETVESQPVFTLANSSGVDISGWDFYANGSLVGGVAYSLDDGDSGEEWTSTISFGYGSYTFGLKPYTFDGAGIRVYGTTATVDVVVPRNPNGVELAYERLESSLNADNEVELSLTLTHQNLLTAMQSTAAEAPDGLGYFDVSNCSMRSTGSWETPLGERGAYSFKVTRSANSQWVKFHQDSTGYGLVPVTEGTVYSAVASVKGGDVTTTATIEIEWFSDLTTSLGVSTNSNSTTTSTAAWTKLAVCEEAPATATYAGIKLSFTMTGSNNYQLVDSVGFFQDYQGWSRGIGFNSPNMLSYVNSNPKGKLGSWLGDGCAVQVGNSDGYRTRDEGTPLLAVTTTTGDYSVQLTDANDYFVAKPSEAIAVEGSTDYTWNAGLQTDSSEAHVAQFWIRWFDSDGDYINTSTGTTANTNTTQYERAFCYVDATSPANAAYAVPGIDFTSNTATGREMRVDWMGFNAGSWDTADQPWLPGRPELFADIYRRTDQTNVSDDSKYAPPSEDYEDGWVPSWEYIGTMEIDSDTLSGTFTDAAGIVSPGASYTACVGMREGSVKYCSPLMPPHWYSNVTPGQFGIPDDVVGGSNYNGNELWMSGSTTISQSSTTINEDITSIYGNMHLRPDYPVAPSTMQLCGRWGEIDGDHCWRLLWNTDGTFEFQVSADGTVANTYSMTSDAAPSDLIDLANIYVAFDWTNSPSSFLHVYYANSVGEDVAISTTTTDSGTEPSSALTGNYGDVDLYLSGSSDGDPYKGIIRGAFIYDYGTSGNQLVQYSPGAFWSYGQTAPADYMSLITDPTTIMDNYAGGPYVFSDSTSGVRTDFAVGVSSTADKFVLGVWGDASTRKAFEYGANRRLNVKTPHEEHYYPTVGTPHINVASWSEKVFAVNIQCADDDWEDVDNLISQNKALYLKDSRNRVFKGMVRDVSYGYEVWGHTVDFDFVVMGEFKE